MADIQGACIHAISGGEDELYNVGIFPEQDWDMWIVNYPIWFSGDYLLKLEDCELDDSMIPYHTQAWIGWKKKSNGKWYDPTYVPPVDPSE